MSASSRPRSSSSSAFRLARCFLLEHRRLPSGSRPSTFSRHASAARTRRFGPAKALGPGALAAIRALTPRRRSLLHAVAISRARENPSPRSCLSPRPHARRALCSALAARRGVRPGPLGGQASERRDRDPRVLGLARELAAALSSVKRRSDSCRNFSKDSFCRRARPSPSSSAASARAVEFSWSARRVRRRSRRRRGREFPPRGGAPRREGGRLRSPDRGGFLARARTLSSARGTRAASAAPSARCATPALAAWSASSAGALGGGRAQGSPSCRMRRLDGPRAGRPRREPSRDPAAAGASRSKPSRLRPAGPAARRPAAPSSPTTSAAFASLSICWRVEDAREEAARGLRSRAAEARSASSARAVAWSASMRASRRRASSTPARSRAPRSAKVRDAPSVREPRLLAQATKSSAWSPRRSSASRARPIVLGSFRRRSRSRPAESASAASARRSRSAFRASASASRERSAAASAWMLAGGITKSARRPPKPSPGAASGRSPFSRARRRSARTSSTSRRYSSFQSWNESMGVFVSIGVDMLQNQSLEPARRRASKRVAPTPGPPALALAALAAAAFMARPSAAIDAASGGRASAVPGPAAPSRGREDVRRRRSRRACRLHKRDESRRGLPGKPAERGRPPTRADSVETRIAAPRRRQAHSSRPSGLDDGNAPLQCRSSRGAGSRRRREMRPGRPSPVLRGREKYLTPEESPRSLRTAPDPSEAGEGPARLSGARAKRDSRPPALFAREHSACAPAGSAASGRAARQTARLWSGRRRSFEPAARRSAPRRRRSVTRLREKRIRLREAKPLIIRIGGHRFVSRPRTERSAIRATPTCLAPCLRRVSRTAGSESRALPTAAPVETDRSAGLAPAARRARSPGAAGGLERPPAGPRRERQADLRPSRPELDALDRAQSGRASAATAAPTRIGTETNGTTATFTGWSATELGCGFSATARAGGPSPAIKDARSSVTTRSGGRRSEAFGSSSTRDRHGPGARFKTGTPRACSNRARASK